MMKTTFLFPALLLTGMITFAHAQTTDSLQTKDKIATPVEILAQYVAQSSMVCGEKHVGSGTITVSGVADEKLSPDMVTFYVQLNVVDKQTSKGTQKLTLQLNELQQKLTAAGFTQKDIKLGNFSITPVIEYTSEKQDFKGYQISQSLEITFEAKRDKMDKLINTLSAEDAERITVSFYAFLSDTKKREAEKRLLKKAINDAAENAEIIADAAKIEIDAVSQIIYNNQDAFFPSLMHEKVAVMQAATPANSNIIKENVLTNLNLEEILLSKSVTVIYTVRKPAVK